MNEPLLNKVRNAKITYLWQNHMIGQFEYLRDRICYRFIETTDYPYGHKVKEHERNDTNCPILIQGFLAFLIYHWGSNELSIYNAYHKQKLQTYINIESKKPGSYKRKLEEEFIKDHLETEQKYINEFKEDFDYISQEEKDLILEFAQNYIGYITEISPIKISKQKNTQSNPIQFEDLLIFHKRKELLEFLHLLIKNKKGKDVVIILIVLEQLGLIYRPSSNAFIYKAIVNEFGDIGTISNFNYYYSPNNRSRTTISEIERIKMVIENHIQTL